MPLRLFTSLSLLALPLHALDVPQWSRFETSLTHPSPPADPLRGTILSATFTRPDGTTLATRGFHDGDATWRLRFMPDQPGTWRYRAAFSDSAAPPPAEGTFTCSASDLPGPLLPHAPNPIWFGTPDGKPFLMRSLHVGDRFFARNWDDPADPADGNPRAAFLDWAQAQGYNTLSVASFLLNRDAKDRGRGWRTPALWPIDPAEYRLAEAILNDLAARRIHLFPFAGFFGRDSRFPRDPADQALYLDYALARLGPYYNLLLNTAGPEPLLREYPYLTFDDVCRLAKTIHDRDPHRRPITVHNATGDDAFRGEPWFGFGTLQGPKTTDRRRLAEGLLRNHHPARPLFAQETLWPGNTFGHPAYSPDDIRRNALVILFSAAMINYGDMAGSSSTGFSSTMNPADAVPERHRLIHQAWDTFAALPWAETKPRPDLVNRGHCLARPGHTYLVYLDEPGTLHVAVEKGTYQLAWIHPENPTEPRSTSSTSTGRDLQPPGPGSWIVKLTRQQP